MTKDDIYGLEIDKKRFIKKVNRKYKGVINSSYQKLRGAVIKSRVDNKKKKDVQANADLEKIITYCRHLLSNPRGNRKTIKYISKQLYAFLIKSIEDHLEDIETLIIIPDGILGFLPFETLITPDGKYLIEKYYIKYAQSLTVLEIINKRKYSKNRKPILAFGGVVYKASTYKKAMISSERQLELLKKKTYLALEEEESTRGSYSALGIASWSNLPGTLTEVKAVKKIYKNAVLITGEDVEESELKDLSDDGELKKYKVIHFATHGIVVSEIPELSAIILSLTDDNDYEDDGYLNMKEIADLNIKADFVNLSACETGLGKIEGGKYSHPFFWAPFVYYGK